MILGPLISTAFAILQAVVLGYFAFYLKDRVDADLKERAQIVSSLQAMQAVLEKLKDSTQPDEREENVVRLAMYGEDAIPVLINLAVAQTRYDQNSMFHALNLLLVWHEKSVCDGLQAALDKRAQFDGTRMDGIQTFHDAKCKTSKK